MNSGGRGRKSAPRQLDRIREEFSESPAAQTNGTNNCSGGPKCTVLRTFRWEIHIQRVELGGLILMVGQTVFDMWLGTL